MRARTTFVFLIALPLAAWGAKADPSSLGSPAQPAAPSVPNSGQTAQPMDHAPVPSNAAPPAAPTAAQPDHGPGSGMYNIGYNEGCATSNLRYARQSGQKPGRDSKLYDSDTDYHDGWNKGYRHCEDKVDQGGLPVMGNSVIQ